MGNSQSSAPPIDHAQLDSIASSFPQLQLEDEQLYVTSSTDHMKTRYDTRQYPQVQAPAQAKDLRRSPGTSSYGSSADLSALGDGRRPSATSATSNTLSGGQLSIQAAIVIIQELTKNASPEQLAILHQAVTALTTNGSGTFAKESSMEKNGKLGENNMMRRRTLLTPGIATRGPDRKSTGKVSSPILEQGEGWSPDMFGQSPLSRLAGWQSSNDGKPEIARSATPDFNDSCLGAHQLGSLRIMNATPASSISDQRPLTKDSNLGPKQDEYFTASEGSDRDSPDKFDEPKLSSRNNDSRSPRAARNIPILQLEDSDVDISFTSSTSSTEHDMRDSEFEAETTEIRDQANLSVGESPEMPASALMMYSVEANSNPFFSQPKADQGHGHAEDSETVAEGNQPENRSQHYGYHCNGSGAPGAPGSYFPPPQRDPPPIPHESSKRMHSMLSTSSSVYSAPPQPISNDDGFRPAKRRLWQDKSHQFFGIRNSILSTSSSVYDTASRPTVTDEKPKGSQVRPTYDSGYGSQSSLQLLKESVAVEIVKELPLDFTPERSLNLADETPEVDVEDYFEHPPFQGSTPDVEREPTLPQLELPSPSPESRPHDSLSSQRRATSNVEQYTSSAPTTPIKVSKRVSAQMSLAKETQTRLQKRRPKSETWNSAPLIVQIAVGDRCDFIGLPRVPSVLASRYSNRLSKNPDMEHLERTFKSVAHSGSRDSVVSHDLEAVPIRFPSPSHPSPSQSFERGRRFLKYDGASRRTSGRFWRSRSRKSTEREESPSEIGADDESPLGITDFRTVNASLGSSPYDLARTEGNLTRPGDCRQPSFDVDLTEPRAMKDPQQLLTVAPRRKVGMDDKAASNFAMDRSRDRREIFDLPEPPKRSLARRPTQHPLQGTRDRPHSFHSMRSTFEPVRTSPLRKEVPARQDPERPQAPSDGARKTAWPPRNTWFEDLTPQPRQTDAGDTMEGEESEDEAPREDWTRPARAWSFRRKSIGENLLTPARDQNVDEENAAKATREPWPSNPKPLGQQSIEQTAPRIPASGLHSRETSPTHSVRERAAAYDRSVGVSTSQEPLAPPQPTRRAPSPPKPTRPAPVPHPTAPGASLQENPPQRSAAGDASRAGAVNRMDLRREDDSGDDYIARPEETVQSDEDLQSYFDTESARGTGRDQILSRYSGGFRRDRRGRFRSAEYGKKTG